MRKDKEKEYNISKTRKSSKKRRNKHKNDLSKRSEVSSSSKSEEDSIDGMERELSEIGITSNLESSRGLIRLVGGTS